MIPEMPKDWWPERITVRVEQDVGDDVLTCQFMMFPEAAQVPAIWKIQLEELRLSMWNAIHAKETADASV